MESTIFQTFLLLLTNICYNGIHEWKFKLLKYTSTGYSTHIGIIKNSYNKNKILNNYLTEYSNSTYVFATDRQCCNIYEKGAEWNTNQPYGKLCKQDDIVDMILDFNKLQLRFKINGIDYGVAFKNIETTTYRAAITLFNSADEITFMS